uniref:Uncharacterized protein n=1 Tax=Mola mola TaxID=94237 RepID=A0A3Q3VJJ1_MOLML
MPRKVLKADKPPLLFLERALCGARLQNVPEVRAALNPKDFFTEREERNDSALKAWVSPQFDSSLPLAPPVRRGRRKCQSTRSILDSSSQLSRKNSISKFPSLTFQTRSRDQSHQPRKRKAAERGVASDAGNQPQGLHQIRTVSHAQCSAAPQRLTSSGRKRNVERCSGGAASSSRCTERPETLSAECASTPPSSELGSIGPPPDVDTPKVIQEGISGPSPTSPPDILVADTPEMDYGLKVTWRRRRGLMVMLKEKGHLSDSDVHPDEYYLD